MNKNEVRLFDITNDLDYIESFLRSRKESYAHNYYNSRDWFIWKFLKSPNGVAIMPTAFNEDKIVGANYYGRFSLLQKGEIIKTTMPYETFVHNSRVLCVLY